MDLSQYTCFTLEPNTAALFSSREKDLFRVVLFNYVTTDEVFDSLLRLTFFGQIGLMCDSPPCKECSRLKLRPGGPAAIRAPEFSAGLRSNTLKMQSRVHSSNARSGATYERNKLA